MADFCMTSDPDLSDMAGLCGPFEVVTILCEGCGDLHYIDCEGFRVEFDHQRRIWARTPCPPREEAPHDPHLSR